MSSVVRARLLALVVLSLGFTVDESGVRFVALTKAADGANTTNAMRPQPIGPSFGDWRKLKEEYLPGQKSSSAGREVMIPPTDLRVTNSASAQNETSIAADPNNPSRVVGGFNDYSVIATGFAGNGVAYSTDGGNTFTHHATGVALPSGYTIGGGDPGLAFDSQGRVYYSHIAFGPGGFVFTKSNGVFVARSDDGGMTWLPTVPVDTNQFFNPAVDFEDKPFVAADHHVSSPFQDRVYLSWTRFYQGNYPGSGTAYGGDIMFSYSTDQGATWSTPTRLTDPAGEPLNGGTGVLATSFVHGSEPEVGPDGSVYVTYWFGGRTSVRRSTDGGVSFGTTSYPFGTPFDVSQLYDHDGSSTNGTQLPNLSFRVNAFPNIETDATRPGHVYVVSVDDFDNTTTGDGAEIIFARSTNFGASWGSTLILNDDGGAVDQIFPWMAVSAQGIIRVIWYDARLGAANTLDVYAAASSDGGVTFGSNTRVTDVTFQPNTGQFSGDDFFGDYNGLGTGGGSFHALWTDGRDAEQEIYYDRVCSCPFQADLDGDTFINAVDLAIEIDIVFFSAADIQDPDCPTTRADFNADGVPDAVDLALLIDHVFFSGSGPVSPC